MQKPRVKTFIRWIGGKSRTCRLIAAKLPEKIETYVEPFLGSGAVFFELAHACRITGTAYLSDANEDLINLYRLVKSDPKRIIDFLKCFDREKSTFQGLLDSYPDSDPDTRAMMLMYITDNAYSGAHRYNRAGHLRSSWSPVAITRPPIEYREMTIMNAHAILNRTNIRLTVRDAIDAFSDCPSDAVIYADPPYIDAHKPHAYAGAYSAEIQGLLYDRLESHHGFVAVSESVKSPLITRAKWCQSIMPKMNNGAKSRKKDGTFIGSWQDALYLRK